MKIILNIGIYQIVCWILYILEGVKNDLISAMAGFLNVIFAWPSSIIESFLPMNYVNLFCGIIFILYMIWGIKNFFEKNSISIGPL